MTDENDLTDPHGEAEALRKDNERLRAEFASGSFYKEADIDALMARAEAAEAALAASRAPDPVANAGSCQPGDLISRAAIDAAKSTMIPEARDAMPSTGDEEIDHGHAMYRAGICDFANRLGALPAAHVTDAQPVAWVIEGYGTTENKDFAVQYGTKLGKAVTPLYAHPPVQPAAPSDGTCKKCGCAPTNADGLCATCRDAQPTIGGAELDALVARLRKLARDMERDATDDWDEHEDVTAAADAITALRAQPDWKATAERLGDAIAEANDTFAGIADHILQHKNAPTKIVWHGVFADCQRGGIAARAALSDLAKMKGE